MKKLFKAVVLVLCLTVGFGVFAACASEKDILVVSRETSSGTRDAFDSLVKNAAGDTLAKTADGTKRDAVTKAADFQNTTGAVMAKVASVKSAIGYISLGSLNDTVKAVTVENIKVTPENVLNGSYKLQRPFVVMSSNSVDLTPATADFMRYLKSAQAQSVVKSKKFVEQASSEQYTAPAETLSGKIVIKGSTSMEDLMGALMADYKLKGGNRVTDVEFAMDAEGSAYGISAVKGDTTGNVIGMGSSSVKDSDKSSFNYFHVALDAVAVIIHNDNTVTNLSIAQLYQIYTGEVKKFSALSTGV